MTHPASPGPAADDPVSRARALLPLVREGVAEGERAARLPDRVIAGMRDAGLFRLLQPSRWGGAEAAPETFFAVQMALSEADMSTGWLQGVMGTLAFHLALFDEAAQDDVWGADPDALMACSYMPTGVAEPVSGGVRLSGRWGFASGADHCDWLLLAGRVARADGPPDLRVFLVPRRDVAIHRTWDTTGLRATGSQDVSVADVFVPAHRAHRHADRFAGTSPGLAVNAAPLYRLPLPQLNFRNIGTPAIGALAGFLDAFLDHSRARVAVGGQAVAHDPVAQQVAGETRAAIDEMAAMLRINFARLMAHAERGGQAPVADRMLYRLQATQCAERCTLLAARLFKACGASGLSRAHPFGRYTADIAAARQHAANQVEAQARALGAALLGVGGEDTVL
ncbi:acyl-CoA dehydrogenase family protein [Salinarimonas rosea]|uniref:acyl-CoA dehydrogenase family protein n=1 Tax=Salinarimonas rosea TaxID=552063 RepID=UPI0003FEEC06|nr:acyl-CoA dehydrogenase family protein [Salinarimonas rosea]